MIFNLFNKKKTAKHPTHNNKTILSETTSQHHTNLKNDDGYFQPLLSEDLLSSYQRQCWLHQIRQAIALPEIHYNNLCLEPLKKLAENLQCLPAGQTGKYQYSGGLLDLTLKMTAYSIRTSQQNIFPKEIPSEEQSRQFSVWNVSVFYAGLFYWLPLASQMEGQLDNQTPWQPGLNYPNKPFRFRFNSGSTDSLVPLLAFKLLPQESLQWLSQYPQALYELSDIIVKRTPTNSNLVKILNDTLNVFSIDELPHLADSNHTIHDQTEPFPTAGISVSAQWHESEGSAPPTLTSSATDLPFTLKKTMSNPPSDLSSEFLDWLKEGLLTKQISVNFSDSPIHVIDNYLFLLSPAIFTMFMRETSHPFERYQPIQKAFESLRLHRKNQKSSGGLMRCRLLNDSKLPNKYQMVSGYLVEAKKLLTDAIRDNSNYIQFE